MQAYPLFRHSQQPRLQALRPEFRRIEPAKLVTFVTHRAGCVSGGNQEIAQIVMPMRRLGAMRGDLVNIKVERFVAQWLEFSNSRLFMRLSARDSRHILVPVAMAAKLQPPIKLAMMMQQGPASISAQDERAPGKVRGKVRPLEAIDATVKKLEHLESKSRFIRPLAKIKASQQGSQIASVHGKKMEPSGIEPLTSSMPLRRSTN